MTPLLIKLGGTALKDPEWIGTFSQDIALLQSYGIPLVLVHGGGPLINDELSLRGISWEFLEGQRVTTEAMMDIIEMVLVGKVNRQIVRRLNSRGIPSGGLSGSDANLLFCAEKHESLGKVGQILSVNIKPIALYLNQGMIPVIAPVGVDQDGHALNVNADWAASRLAQALGIRKIIYLTDQNGILNWDGTLIRTLNPEGLRELIRNKIVTGGMLTKVNSILDGLENQIREIYILNAKSPHAVLEGLDAQPNLGTLCRKQNYEISIPHRGESHA